MRVMLRFAVETEDGTMLVVIQQPVEVPGLLGPPPGAESIEHFSTTALARELARRVESHGEDL